MREHLHTRHPPHPRPDGQWALLLCLVAALTLAGPGVTQARDRSFKPGVLKRLCQGSAVCYSEPPSIPAELKDFWKVHPRFGFFFEGRRLVLGAHDRQIARQVIADLKKHSGRVRSEAGPISPSAVCAGPKGSCFFDVTDIAAPEIVDRHHVRPRTYGSNCFNFCLSHRLFDGPYPVDYPSLRELLTAPFAREVRNPRSVRPGDVILIEQRGLSADQTRGVHGAVLVSPNLVLSKNGLGQANPYRLMDLQEMISLYGGEDRRTKVYRVETLDRLIKTHGARLPPRLLRDLGTVSKLEQGLARHVLDRGQPPLSATERRRQASFYRDLQKVAGELWQQNEKRYFDLYPAILMPEKHRPLTEQDHLEYKFLNLLMTKLSALRSASPPARP